MTCANSGTVTRNHVQIWHSKTKIWHVELMTFKVNTLNCQNFHVKNIISVTKKREKQHPTFTGLSRSGRAFHALGGPSHGHSRSFMLIHAHIFSPEIQNVVFEFLGNQASTATVMMLSVRLWRNNRWPYFPPIYYPLTSNSPVLLRNLVHVDFVLLAEDMHMQLAASIKELHTNARVSI